MVGTRTSAIEPHVNDSIKNWVTDHVNQTTANFNEKFDTVNATLNNILAQLNFVVTDVNRLKGSEVDNVPDGDKIKIVSIHLYDKALAWHLQFIRAHGETVGWDVYEEGILKRFGVVNEDPMAELKNLRYGSNMKEY
ncbi:hypothetical protein Tco_0153842 [Tanacetum coccineum]